MKKVPRANAIGPVMSSMVSIRPNLSYAISLLSTYMFNPGKLH